MEPTKEYRVVEDDDGWWVIDVREVAMVENDFGGGGEEMENHNSTR